MDNNNIVALKINGVAYSGWLSVDIASNLTGLARTFKVSATRKNSNDGVSIPFEPGDEVQVMIDDDKIITGYVEKIEVSYSSTNLSIEVSSSSKTIDLVQCQIPLGKPHSWKNVPVTKILSDLAGYYGVSVINRVNLQDKDTVSSREQKNWGRHY